MRSPELKNKFIKLVGTEFFLLLYLVACSGSAAESNKTVTTMQVKHGDTITVQEGDIITIEGPEGRWELSPESPSDTLIATSCVLGNFEILELFASEQIDGQARVAGQSRCIKVEKAGVGTKIQFVTATTGTTVYITIEQNK